jgi:competence protein ComFC
LCRECREKLFVPTIRRRTIGTLEVVSFYRYSTIEFLLLRKHRPEGYRIFHDLARWTLKPFIRNFVAHDPSPLTIIGIDESPHSGYSHVACLTHQMKTAYSKPLHGVLVPENRVSYAGKSLQYRLDHPREFRYDGPEGIDVVLVDDIVTTGLTLQEAQMRLLEHGVNVLFALTLADAKE